MDRRRRLAADLRLAAERVHHLEEKLLTFAAEENSQNKKDGKVRVRALARSEAPIHKAVPEAHAADFLRSCD